MVLVDSRSHTNAVLPAVATSSKNSRRDTTCLRRLRFPGRVLAPTREASSKAFTRRGSRPSDLRHSAASRARASSRAPAAHWCHSNEILDIWGEGADVLVERSQDGFQQERSGARWRFRSRVRDRGHARHSSRAVEGNPTQACWEGIGGLAGTDSSSTSERYARDRPRDGVGGRGPDRDRPMGASRTSCTGGALTRDGGLLVATFLLECGRSARSVRTTSSLPEPHRGDAILLGASPMRRLCRVRQQLTTGA